MSTRAPRLIVVEDSHSDFLLLQRCLREQYPDVECHNVTGRDDLVTALEAGGWDAVLCDFSVPGLDFSEGQALITTRAPDLPLVLVSGSVGEERAVELITGGVWDFVLKGNLKRLVPALKRVLQEAEQKEARLQAEEALRQSESRYRMLMETAFDWIWEVDAESRYCYASLRVQSILGYAPMEVIGRTPFDFMPPQEASRIREQINVVSAAKKPFSNLLHMSLARDGRLVMLESSGAPLFSATGELLGYRGCDRDVTERWHAEEALRMSEEHYRAMIVNAPYGVLTAETNGVLLSANPAFAAILGFDSPGQILREANQEGLARFLECHPQVGELLALQPGEDGPWQRLENVQLTKKDGTPALVNLEVRRFRSQRTGQYELEGFVEDITEKKKAEQEHQVLIEQMQQSQKMEAVGKLAGGIAHDFNNLITVIGGYSEYALARATQGTPLHAALTQITAAAKKAAALTSQLLAFSRNQILEPKTVDLSALIAGIIEMLRRLLGEDVELKVSSPSDLWPVMVDPGKMEQVIMNLALNGRDAMPAGGVLAISASNFGVDAKGRDKFPDATGDFVALTVSDTGVGMDDETRKRIFEPFFTTKPKGKGTGLGLAIVYGIAKQSGGHIRCESAPGDGAEFVILLPRSRQPETAPITAHVADQVKGGVETILLVEDDQTVRSFAALVLRGAGYTVIEAIDGVQALDIASRKSGQIHFIVCDVVMPHMDGPAVVRAITPLLGQIPVLFMSGYAQIELNSRGVLDPGVRLLHKPFTSAGLKQIVRTMLDESVNH